jgi:hypothetical protein
MLDSALYEVIFERTTRQYWCRSCEEMLEEMLEESSMTQSMILQMIKISTEPLDPLPSKGKSMNEDIVYYVCRGVMTVFPSPTLSRISMESPLSYICVYLYHTIKVDKIQPPKHHFSLNQPYPIFLLFKHIKVLPGMFKSNHKKRQSNASEDLAFRNLLKKKKCQM